MVWLAEHYQYSIKSLTLMRRIWVSSLGHAIVYFLYARGESYEVWGVSNGRKTEKGGLSSIYYQECDDKPETSAKEDKIIL